MIHYISKFSITLCAAVFVWSFAFDGTTAFAESPQEADGVIAIQSPPEQDSVSDGEFELPAD